MVAKVVSITIVGISISLGSGFSISRPLAIVGPSSIRPVAPLSTISIVRHAMVSKVVTISIERISIGLSYSLSIPLAIVGPSSIGPVAPLSTIAIVWHAVVSK